MIQHDKAPIGFQNTLKNGSTYPLISLASSRIIRTSKTQWNLYLSFFACKSLFFPIFKSLFPLLWTSTYESLRLQGACLLGFFSLQALQEFTFFFLCGYFGGNSNCALFFFITCICSTYFHLKLMIYGEFAQVC